MSALQTVKRQVPRPATRRAERPHAPSDDPRLPWVTAAVVSMSAAAILAVFASGLVR